MAKVIWQMVGGEKHDMEADTVFTVRLKLGLPNHFQFSVNGEPEVNPDTSFNEPPLVDGDFISIAHRVGPTGRCCGKMQWYPPGEGPEVKLKKLKSKLYEFMERAEPLDHDDLKGLIHELD